MSSKGKEVVHSSGGGRCAACELLDHACHPGCVFAPYFPAGDDPARFGSVHAAFGHYNVAHFLRCFRSSEHLRAEAARWLVLNAPRRLAGASGGTQPPCAACLHLGDPCAGDQMCVFARHFPAGDDPERFAAVDNRFGADDVAVFLCGFSPDRQEEAVRNMVLIAQQPAPPPPPVEGGRLPCAACRYLRRPCVPNCLFRPYFPPDDDPERFAAVHSLYGTSNLDRRIRYLPPELRQDAAATLAYEARRRQGDPVFGATGDVQLLVTAIKMAEADLATAREKLVPYVGEEAASRYGVLPWTPTMPPAAATMQQVLDRMKEVAELVGRRSASDAAAGVTDFVTPLHEYLVKGMAAADVPGSSTAAVPGPVQPAADAVQDPGLPEEEEDAGDDVDEPSHQAKRCKVSAEGSSKE